MGEAGPCPGCVGAAGDDAGAVEPPPVSAGAPAVEPAVTLGAVRPWVGVEVPVTCGPPLPGSAVGDEEEPPGTEADTRNPGWTKPSTSSSTTSSPAPVAAMATRLGNPGPPAPAPAEAPRPPRWWTPAGAQ